MDKLVSYFGILDNIIFKILVRVLILGTKLYSNLLFLTISNDLRIVETSGMSIRHNYKLHVKLYRRY